jgi:uncharacterized membrane protein YozB (DUF420 family)
MDPTTDEWAMPAARIAIVVMVLLVAVVIVLNSDIAAKGGQQFNNTNMAATFSVLGFLGGAAALLLAIIVIAVAMASGHRRLARAMAVVAAVEVVLYAAMLIGYSSRSQESVLAVGQEKYFCEIDCHIAYAITGVERKGSAVTVALRTRFDQRTIAPWRGDATLTPSPRVIEVTDASGHLYLPHHSDGPELTTPLRPGQSYTTQYSFDVPADARDVRLLVLDAGVFPECVLIGNENSFLHSKTAFRL